MSLKIRVSNTNHGNPGVSGWYAILPEPEPPCILQEDITTDWLVIGGGFAGLSAARRLNQLRANERIVLLDSIRIGEGSSGRNSGFMIDLPHDISTDSYAGAVEQDVLQTRKNRYAIAFAAEAADGFSYQKPIKRYEQTPTNSQNMKRSNNEFETTNPSITETKSDISAKYLTRLSPSPAMYPIEKIITRKDIEPTTNNIIAAREST